MSKEQIELALKMNKSGIEWQTIAVYFKADKRTLLKYRKQYQSTNATIG